MHHTSFPTKKIYALLSLYPPTTHLSLSSSPPQTHLPLFHHRWPISPSLLHFPTKNIYALLSLYPPPISPSLLHHRQPISPSIFHHSRPISPSRFHFWWLLFSWQLLHQRTLPPTNPPTGYSPLVDSIPKDFYISISISVYVPILFSHIFLFKFESSIFFMVHQIFG